MIYKYKTEGRSPKDLKNYQHVVELFTDLRDGNINRKEVLKDQFNNKSDLGEIKKRKSKTKIIRLNKCYKNAENIFDLIEKIIDFFRDYPFLLSEAKYKAKSGTSLKVLTAKQMLEK